MASLYHDGIDDFVELVLNRFTRNSWVDISLILQEYQFASRWFKSKKRPERGGPLLDWKLRVANQGTAKHSGLFAIDDTNKVNVMINGQINWSKQTVNYIYDVDQIAFESNPETIIREMVLNEQGLYNDFFELMETSMWTSPSSATVNPRPPAGIPAWLVKASSEGFNGGDGNFSGGIGGIPTATYANWKNWGAPYVSVSRDDLIEKVCKGMDYTRFKAVKPYSEIGGGDPSYGLYTVYSVLSIMRRLLQANNDNLGIDVARFSNGVVVRGVPVDWVPALDNTASDAYDSQNPFYGINWKKFHYFFKTGRNMIKHPPKVAARQHTVRERHMDNWGNFVCEDRRQGGFVFHVA